MRLFAALHLQKESVDLLLKATEGPRRLSSRVRWVPRGQYHVTLRFFGDTDASILIRRMEELKLAEYLPVTYELNRSGTFGRPPSVLWVSGRFSSEVFTIASLLGSIPDGEGRLEKRRFVPHVTLARFRPGDPVPCLKGSVHTPGTASSLSLISSVLTPSGPVYTPVFTMGA